MKTLDRIRTLKHPNLYQASDIQPCKREITSSPCMNHIRAALRHIEWCLESGPYDSGQSNHLGEWLDDIQRVKEILDSAVRGREIPGAVLVRRSGGWIRRKVETK